MRLSPPTLCRIIIEAAGLMVLQVLLLQILARVRLLEHLLAPGSHSYWAIVATVVFLLLRFFLYLFGAGWLAARLWLWATRERSPGQLTGGNRGNRADSSAAGS
jgi:hypothetical protein